MGMMLAWSSLWPLSFVAHETFINVGSVCSLAKGLLCSCPCLALCGVACSSGPHLSFLDCCMSFLCSCLYMFCMTQTWITSFWSPVAQRVYTIQISSKSLVGTEEKMNKLYTFSKKTWTFTFCSQFFCFLACFSYVTHCGRCPQFRLTDSELFVAQSLKPTWRAAREISVTSGPMPRQFLLRPVCHFSMCH